ncbi:DNA mismatch repair protein MutS [Hungatella hathewayi 12489931]|jgi:DNA mismatch repair protein MutS|nr:MULTISPECIES: DNA mismatch repair protein MutS [Hungatella]ENY92520.1 DNA mismatch repair protein MutS [Hungatella hathewayi 12489931]MBC5702786.1 DNA mismatch repair protein MutS [Hungatella sp. L36]MBS5239214.1 DNA mismatch repair protein MutS [Hungatella hathewayi]MDU0930445.1 DNA mismatch repair protein MutS [Hungatella hathewayi]RGD70954.1 DNA mismatch repair protein MutS [Hungatella hathewayi]
MMVHYLETKKQYPDCILFYRLGDFYEMFFEDALTVSKELEITLTGKECGLEERAPMCGIPYHALENYLYRLVQKGYKVAIAEQMEDPKLAKGLVKREVIRVVTPGTITSAQALDETKNNYLMGIVYIDERFGIAVSDISTGDFLVTEVETERELADEINKFSPSEIICNDAFFVSGVDTEEVKNRYQTVIAALDNHFFSDEGCRRILKEHFKVGSLDGLGLQDYDTGVIAAGAVMEYMYETQKSTLSHITTIVPYSTGQFMIIDTSTRRNLELLETMREKQKRGTLLWVLDKTKTAMGARLLRTYIEQPLIHKDDIIARQNAIEELNMNYISREEICEYLNPIYDLERLIGRISYKTANPRDLISFRNSLEMLPYIKDLMGEFTTPLLKELWEELDALEDVHDLVSRAIVEDPPISLRDGGIIKDGYHEETDKLRHAKTEGKTWLAELESRERDKTGIKNLKVKYNKVFGYYFEVTNSFKGMVPDYFVRKQTLANAERYTTDELKELEDMILGAEDKLYTLEYGLFCEVRDAIAAEVLRIQQTARAIAGIDVMTSLSVVATKNNYVKPRINEKGVIDIKNGRHPVVEKMMRDDLFVANDTYLDNSKNRLSIITGPNMAGKSTYMRQTALIVLMAQLGSFVPADDANIGICDRIFTRVGASDDLASGQSTFMVEMTEVANILRNATKNSLIVLDEIGRGTSTFDGLSIAWAVVEHISNPKLLGAKTLFATHYHELTELEGTINGVNNYCIAVKEQGDDIVFLRKIVKGGADKSYGVQVAKLAGVPDSVIVRAKELLVELSDADITARAKEIAEAGAGAPKHASIPRPDEVDLQQMSLFDTVKDDDIVRELGELELGNMTPIDALNTLYRLQTKLKNRWQ